MYEKFGQYIDGKWQKASNGESTQLECVLWQTEIPSWERTRDSRKDGCRLEVCCNWIATRFHKVLQSPAKESTNYITFWR